jgi:hypothetical protein
VVEFGVTWATVFFPLTMMLIFTTQLLWTWHSVVEFTREGARYAATHCYQGAGNNVVTYMQQNVPPVVDQDALTGGEAEIVVSYYQKNAETGDLEEFTCTGAECTRECVPDAVTVSLNNYQFNGFLGYLGLPAVALPNFSTTVAVQSAGCGPDEEACLQ